MGACEEYICGLFCGIWTSALWCSFCYALCCDDPDKEKEKQPRIVVSSHDPNPFRNPGAPKDAHLQRVYD